LEFLITAITQEEEIKEIQTEKEEVKLFLFADDTILYLKDPKNFTKKLLAIIKHLHQSSRIQNQYTKINSFSIDQQ
jgi:hypothetical protein